jgi:hypothetical protein
MNNMDRVEWENALSVQSTRYKCTENEAGRESLLLVVIISPPVRRSGAAQHVETVLNRLLSPATGFSKSFETYAYCEISDYEVDSMQDSFIIRNHDDYLRAHITVLRRSPQKLELVVISEKQSDTKGDRCQQRPQVNGRGKPAKYRFSTK